MSKHTPGPWRVGDSHLEITDADGHRAIAEVRDYDGWEEISEEEQEANLRLIAAAPDLLATLKEAEAMFRWYGDLHAAKPDHDKAKRNYDMADKCAAAIAKAEGRV